MTSANHSANNVSNNHTSNNHAQASKRKKRKKVIKWVIIALIILALVALAYYKFKPRQDTPNYITASAHIGDIENNVMASGKVKAINTVDVGAQVSGEVTKLYVDVGDEVKQGDLIAQIDQVTQKNNLSNQEASLRQTQAALQSSQAELLSRQASLESSKADLASREAELTQAQTDLARLQSLLAMNAISQQEYDAAKTNVDTAAARVVNAKAAIHTAKAALITAQSNITSNEAALQKAQTDLDTATENLGYTTIRAPMDGTVVAVVTEQGSTVNAMQTAPTIVTLADLSTVRINAQISEADVVNVEAGMPVYFNIIGNPDKQYDAVLKAIEPAPENISATSSTNAAVYYIGYIEVPNPDRRFRIDMTAQVFIVIDQASDALLVPSVAIKEGTPPPNDNGLENNDKKISNESDAMNTAPNTAQNIPLNNSRNQISNDRYVDKYVRVLLADGTVNNQSVKVGIDNRVNAQILNGLQAGDEVIISEESNAMGSGMRGGPPPR